MLLLSIMAYFMLLSLSEYPATAINAFCNIAI
jgi:hypothetical protein